jgi:hypothetical protein
MRSDDKTRWDLERMAEYRKKKEGKGVDLQPDETDFPVGNLFQHEVTDLF